MALTTQPDRLRALGEHLDRTGIGDAFIAIAPGDITVTPIAGRLPRQSLVYGLDELSHLSVGRTGGGAPPAGAGTTISHAALLARIGRDLRARACHAAFIVVYDGLVLIDYGLLGAAPSPVAAGGRDGVLVTRSRPAPLPTA
jgi:hypothetical protein